MNTAEGSSIVNTMKRDPRDVERAADRPRMEWKPATWGLQVVYVLGVVALLLSSRQSGWVTAATGGAWLLSLFSMASLVVVIVSVGRAVQVMRRRSCLDAPVAPGLGVWCRRIGLALIALGIVGAILQLLMGPIVRSLVPRGSEQRHRVLRGGTRAGCVRWLRAERNAVVRAEPDAGVRALGGRASQGGEFRALDRSGCRFRSRTPDMSVLESRRSTSVKGRIGRAALAVSVILALFGCEAKPLEWREEVGLAGGETIVMQRTARLRVNAIAGGGGGSINQGMSVEIVRPIRPDNPGPWSNRYVPVVLDRDPTSNEWFIVATFYHCDSWYDLGRVRPSEVKNWTVEEKRSRLSDPRISREFKQVTDRWPHGC